MADNFYVEGGGVPVRPGRGFAGDLENFNVREMGEGVGHFNIEENDRLHARAVEAALRTFAGVR